MNRAIELRPADPDFLWERGNLLLEVKRLDEAAADFTKALAIDAGHVPSLVSLGQCLLAAGEYGKAIQTFGRALELKPGEPVVLANLGVAYEYADDGAASVRYYQAAARLGFAPAQAYLKKKGVQW
jgi:superkiller protein 3